MKRDRYFFATKEMLLWKVSVTTVAFQDPACSLQSNGSKTRPTTGHRVLLTPTGLGESNPAAEIPSMIAIESMAGSSLEFGRLSMNASVCSFRVTPRKVRREEDRLENPVRTGEAICGDGEVSMAVEMPHRRCFLREESFLLLAVSSVEILRFSE